VTPAPSTPASGAILDRVPIGDGPVAADVAQRDDGCPTAAGVPLGPGRRRPRVLVVDDDPLVLSLTSRILAASGFRCQTIQDGRHAVDVAIGFAADIVLLDVHMAPISGAAVLEALRSDYRTALTPVICVTSDCDPATLVALLGAGADDYICKPFRADELEARMLVAVRRRAMLVSVNPLTGLPGNVVLTAAIEQRLRSGPPFALLHVDVDNFKAYNDHYGFVRGDEVIAALGSLLDGALASVGARNRLLAHIGGDDFAILTDANRARPTAVAVLLGFDRLSAELHGARAVERGSVVTADATASLAGTVAATGADPAEALLSVSIGIATTVGRTFASAAAMADAAAQVKGVAKRAPGSAFAVDRRRG
jgi:diguanylate cyclase (GGDEF)-like protein